jgi:hypothetical protein
MRPEKKNPVSCPVFWPEELSHMAVSASFGELHLKNMAESRTDNAESRNERRNPHNFESFSSIY